MKERLSNRNLNSIAEKIIKYEKENEYSKWYMIGIVILFFIFIIGGVYNVYNVYNIFPYAQLYVIIMIILYTASIVKNRILIEIYTLYLNSHDFYMKFE